VQIRAKQPAYGVTIGCYSSHDLEQALCYPQQQPATSKPATLQHNDNFVAAYNQLRRRAGNASGCLCCMQAPKPSPGPHKQRECLPLLLVLRNRLK
jgi:hypothetical protein